MGEDPNSRIAAELHGRFQYYILGLTFGVLALAVQTGKFEGSLYGRIAELVGWSALLVSGLVGLSRAEWMPKAYQLGGMADLSDAHLHEYRKALELGTASVAHVTREGKDYSIVDLIKTQEAALVEIKQAIAKLDRRSRVKYYAQRIFFVGGLTALVVARGLDPLLKIIADWR